MPGQVDYMADVRRQVQLFGYPVFSIGVAGQRSDRVVHDNKQISGFVNRVRVRQIVAMPETERGRVGSGQVDGWTDEKRFDIIDGVSIEIAAPGIGR